MRAAPCDIPLVSVPDLIQSRYGDYLYNISGFMYSAVYKIKTSSACGSYPIHHKTLPKGFPRLPFNTIPINMLFERPLSEEQIAELKGELGCYPSMANGKPSLVFDPTNWNSLSQVVPFKPVPTTPSPIEAINLGAAVVCRDVIAILSALFYTHKYPAFVDFEHCEAVRGFGKKGDDVEMDLDDETVFRNPPVAPFGNRTVTASFKYMPIDMKTDSANRESIPSFLQMEDEAFALPAGEGLWFPYFSALANYDVETVPDFFDRFLAKSLAEDIEDVFAGVRKLRGEWGMIGKTEVGKQISHLVKVADAALQAQARAIPVFRGTKYEGCFMNGGGYTVDASQKAYRPQDVGTVELGFHLADIHSTTLRKIGTYITEETDRDAVMGVKDMFALRNTLRKVPLSEEAKENILKLVPRLKFQTDATWSVNVGTLDNAFSLIKATEELTEDMDLPIHHSVLFSSSKEEIVWSCFGAMAPSFMIPGGKTFPLKSDMSVETKLPSGALMKKEIVRISVRSKPLAQAIEDLREMRKMKYIQNPLVASKVRTSQQYQDKMFESENGKKIMRLLREFCDVEYETGKGKKRARDDTDESEEPARKRGRLIGSLDDV
jgi:hypothetical protein